MSKIIIAGGTGFLGKELEKFYQSLNYSVIIISRTKGISWDNTFEIAKAIDGADLIVNLAGKSVNCRYNKKNKEEIINSRVNTTKIIGEAIEACTVKPKLWINASTATIYKDSLDKANTEYNNIIGNDFSVEVAKKWEETFFSFNFKNVRQVALRISIVLGRNSDMIKILKNLVSLYLGGTQGSGTQKFSWIHILDFCNAVKFIEENEKIFGAVNICSNHVSDNRTFMHLMRNKLNVKIGLPAPKIAIELGAFLMQTESELVLKSRYVLPEVLNNNGFEFTYPTLDKALEEILTSK